MRVGGWEACGRSLHGDRDLRGVCHPPQGTLQVWPFIGVLSSVQQAGHTADPRSLPLWGLRREERLLTHPIWRKSSVKYGM